jgi:hypothetical protein
MGDSFSVQLNAYFKSIIIVMKQGIKINGIYDERTLKELALQRIIHQSFDFRPTSFNFLQEYKFLDLMETFYLPSNFYYLRFQGEKDFVISKLLSDLKKMLVKKNPFLDGGLERVYLEFSDMLDRSFYEQFNIPYFWHYDPTVPLANYLGSPMLKGIVLSYQLLEGMHDRGTIYNFIQNTLQQIYTSGNQGLRIIVDLDWDSNIFPSLLDLIDVDLLALPVNNKIEVCYRNVDVLKLKGNILHYKNLSL